MGFVYRKPYTMPPPASAEIIERDGRRLARWRLRNGRTQTAEVVEGADGQPRVRGRSSFFTARYRDASGRNVEISTGCRDETAARQVLADLVKRAERVRAGLVTSAEDATIDHSGASLETHINGYLSHLRNKQVNGRRVSSHHCRNVEHNLRRLARECKFARLSNITRLAVERWLDQREAEGMAARTRNAHLAAMVAFCNWCVQTHRLVASPLNRMSKANEKADPRRQRRALTEEELVRLLDVARRRPLLEATTIRRGKRKGQPLARLNAETRTSLERLGWERSLIYKTLVLTGLRKGELASITVGQVELTKDGVSYVVLRPQDEKSGRGSEIPIRADLANDLRAWLGARLRRARDVARENGDPIPSTLPPSEPLFNVPTGLIRIFDLDLVAAGIAKRVKRDGKWIIDKRDDRGRTIDVHALRHTFGTHLSKGGVAPRTAQAAMRHSTLDLTMNTYTDPRLLDVAGALDVLPALPLDSAEAVARAVGDDAPHARRDDRTSHARPRNPRHLAPNLAPALAPTGDSPWQPAATAGKVDALEEEHGAAEGRRASDARAKTRDPVATAVPPRQKKRATGLEPATFSLEGKRRSVQTTPNTRVTREGRLPRTQPCTDDSMKSDDALARVAEALVALSPAEQAHLADLLRRSPAKGAG